MAGDVLERAWKLPAGGEASAQGLVIHADDLGFQIDVAGFFLGGAFGDFHQRFAESLHLDQNAHVVDEAGEESFVRQGVVQFRDDQLGHDTHGNRVGPEVFGGEVRRNAAAAEKFGQRGGDDDIFHGVETQKHDGAVDRADLAGQAVKRGVDDFEDARDQGGVVGD